MRRDRRFNTLRNLFLILAMAATFAWRTVAAHEFWVLPDRFQVPPGSSVSLSLSVGEHFDGQPVGFSQPLIARFTRHSGGVAHDLRSLVPGAATAAVRVRLDRAGPHLLAIDTHPTAIELEASEFNEYLRTDGLLHVLEHRRATGTLDTPGRERYRRNIKTLVRAGSAEDDTFAVRTGQRLEIVLMDNPSRWFAGATMRAQVLFDGKPLERALVRFWHRAAGRTHTHEVWTSADGGARFAPAQPGVWMASVVHMVPAADSREHDWDSYWGNYTFRLSAP